MTTQRSSILPPRQSHLSYLDGLRACAAMYVVLFHALIQIEPNGKVLVGKEKLLATFFTFGHQAVDLFIVISGFCLMLPVLKQEGQLRGGAKVFLLKRARRILPPYFIALGFTLLAIQVAIGKETGTGWDAFLPVTRDGLWAHVLLLQDVFIQTAEQINGAFWSISVEWRIYFAFPLLLLLWRRIGPFAAATATIIFSYALLLLLSRTPLNSQLNATVGIMPHYLGLFALGMLGAGICYSHDTRLVQAREHVPWMPLACTTFVLVFVLCKVPLLHGARVPVAFTDLVAGVWAMSLLVAVSVKESSLLRRVLSWKPLAFVGTYAYSVYLIHGPLQQMVWQYVIRPWHWPPFAVFVFQSTIGLLIILILSYGFFIIGERPFLRSPLSKRIS